MTEQQIRTKAINDCIYWVKDWWCEDLPYGFKGIIKRLNKLKYEQKDSKHL